MNIGARTAAWSDRNPYQTSDNALITMFDGWWNNGIDSHATSPSKWVDLCGNSTLTTEKGTLKFGDKYAVFDGSTFVSFENASLIDALNNDRLAVEIVAFSNTVKNNAGLIKIGNRGLWIWSYGSTVFNAWSYRVASGTTQSILKNYNKAIRIVLNNKILNFDDSARFVGSGTQITTDNKIVIGSLELSAELQMNLYSIRFYNRNLTTDEVSERKTLDFNRFNLT